jgi:hypothetical protein
MNLKIILIISLALTYIVAAPGRANAQEKKPNIVVIWGDDIGMWNLGAYTHGMMGRTPDVDQIAKEGILFTDHYGRTAESHISTLQMTRSWPKRRRMAGQREE